MKSSSNFFCCMKKTKKHKTQQFMSENLSVLAKGQVFLLAILCRHFIQQIVDNKNIDLSAYTLLSKDYNATVYIRIRQEIPTQRSKSD